MIDLFQKSEMISAQRRDMMKNIKDKIMNKKATDVFVFLKKFFICTSFLYIIVVCLVWFVALLWHDIH